MVNDGYSLHEDSTARARHQGSIQAAAFFVAAHVVLIACVSPPSAERRIQSLSSSSPRGVAGTLSDESNLWAMCFAVQRGINLDKQSEPHSRKVERVS